mgnify:CR=1 FL=1
MNNFWCCCDAIFVEIAWWALRRGRFSSSSAARKFCNSSWATRKKRIFVSMMMVNCFVFPIEFWSQVKEVLSWIATKNEFKLQEVVHRKKSWEKKKIISENSDISFGHFLLVTHQKCCFLPTTRSSFLDHFNDRVLKKQDADAI